jgi:hypothetical protein
MVSDIINTVVSGLVVWGVQLAAAAAWRRISRRCATPRAQADGGNRNG